MPFSIVRNDITKMNTDAIVNTANPRPRVGSGTDSALFAAAYAARNSDLSGCARRGRVSRPARRSAG